MIPVDGDFILEVAPRFSGSRGDRQRQIIEEISSDLQSILKSYKLDTYLRIAHFMAQVTHECAGFRTTEEFATGEAYEGRADLGNDQPGDGVRFKGRGLIQLTGRHNYRRYGDRLGLDLIGKPRIAAQPLISLRVACEYWKDHKINKAADRDDLIHATRLVNGGRNGLDDRRRYLRKAKLALARRAGVIIGAAQKGDDPVMRRGTKGLAVERLQEQLNKHGGMVTIDGDFGGATEQAVRVFQKSGELAVDGVIGKIGWKALSSKA